MTVTGMTVLDRLRAAATAEKVQTLFYRRLAGEAEAASGSPDVAERINGLLADEQHHLSRLVARLNELGVHADIRPGPVPQSALGEWEAAARARERGEIERYEQLLELDLDTRTRAMIEEFLEVERRHEETLGGKWMEA